MQSTSLLKEQGVCQICEKNLSKYVCPRCGLPYCSLSCYKHEVKHLQCSESFYRDCVVENIKSEAKQNPESSGKMNEILQRFHEQYNQENAGEDDIEELDSDDDEPLDKRLTGVDLNNADEVWKHLSDEEKQEFQVLVKNMEAAGGIIPEWVPWWDEEPEKKLVVEMSEDSQEETTFSSNNKLHHRQPDVLGSIPKMSELTRVQPSEHVAKGLVNVISAYVWTAKLFNGDLFDAMKLLEVASSIIHLSSFLKKDGLFKNLEHAIADVPMNACQVPEFAEGGTSIHSSLNRDVWKIIKGPESVKNPLLSKTYLLSSLTECYAVFVRASKSLKANGVDSDTARGSGSDFVKLFPSSAPVLSADIKLINKAKRKLLYLLAFANEFMSEGVNNFIPKLNN